MSMLGGMHAEEESPSILEGLIFEDGDNPDFSFFIFFHVSARLSLYYDYGFWSDLVEANKQSYNFR